MTTQDIIDHIKAGRPLTKNVAKKIIRELERVKALEEALLDISGKMTTKELASACVCDPDIEFGYDEIIRVARKALEGK